MASAGRNTNVLEWRAKQPNVPPVGVSAHLPKADGVVRQHECAASSAPTVVWQGVNSRKNEEGAGIRNKAAMQRQRRSLPPLPCPRMPQ